MDAILGSGRSPLWARVADDLRRAILGGTYPPGSQLPNEQGLMQLYRVSRNTLRRAVAELELRGLLRTEQGRGSFVQERLDYALGARTRLTDNLLGTGLTAKRRLREMWQVPASPEAAEALGIPLGDPAWRVVSLQCVDGAEINIATSWYSARRFPDFDQRRQQEESVTRLFRSYGIPDYVRAWTRLFARRATEAEARALRQPAASPVLEIHKLDAAPDGTPLAYGSGVWAADRVQLVVPGPGGTMMGEDRR
ncbi:phosphonate metabolism transcriptional regulator PhnF [Roseomonas hellenica]|uniref:Phosphonate metabolism transcriptional regulator PhnF n=1 Tax=Plastoroseomonas hellenica TaxID=2687306 RepID=A0ABS5EXU7_9PROT|nr:phosphonate metabolism transcriptional regulator PhnF [Plastoroseomonas hellenica]MBR0665133.1 phosphonate metabolism transcriptional regulator PhnF [Plastoroseomonas hellenica]